MSAQARLSSPPERQAITDLLQEAIGTPNDSIAIEPRFQFWKYWGPHPLEPGYRSYVVNGQDSIAAHGCVWPISLRGTAETFKAIFLIDWAARNNAQGAGLQLLSDCTENADAAFFIGGTAYTRKVIPAYGAYLSRRTGATYGNAGHLFFLSRPLKPFSPVLSSSGLDWKTPARAGRNLMRFYWPRTILPNGYSFSEVAASDIPDKLWPLPTSDPVSARTPELLRHFQECPAFNNAKVFLLEQGGAAIAYFFLAERGNEVRLADYGPAGMDSNRSKLLGIAAQQAARKSFPAAEWIVTATSEASVRDGFCSSGFRQTGQEEIRVITTKASLRDVTNYRLSYLDLDIVCL
jgi:hypothetical protein